MTKKFFITKFDWTLGLLYILPPRKQFNIYVMGLYNQLFILKGKTCPKMRQSESDKFGTQKITHCNVV